jgi:hypothetical protein
VSLDLASAAAKRDVHPLGLRPLDCGQSLDVRADLQQCRGLYMARQLRVHHLVAPRADGAWPLDAQQEVREPEPPAVEERGLVDGVVAAPDCLGRGRGGGPQLVQPSRAGGVVVPGVDSRDASPVGFQSRQVASLVLETSLRDEVDFRIDPGRAFHQPGERRQLQAHEVLAGQETDQIGRGEDRIAADELHRRSR